MVVLFLLALKLHFSFLFSFASLEPLIFVMVGWLIMLVMVLVGCELVVKDQLRRNLILIYPRLGKPNY